jgi:hypothetical protein
LSDDGVIAAGHGAILLDLVERENGDFVYRRRRNVIAARGQG